jgi:osmoprotectant transport system ATP-binding protein
MGAAALSLVGVAKRYGGHEALKATDLSVAPGETVVLIGPSGCGKSTLLRLIVGLVVPDAGRVRVGDLELTPETVLGARRRIGYVIQDGGLFPHLTAEENVTLAARWLGWERPRLSTRVAELAALVQLPAAALARYPVELSGGQRQRVSLMRALMLDPDVLLLDEPLGALDPMIRADLQTDLRTIFRSLKKTVVIVTHDLAEAAFFANRIVLLRDGSIVQQGPYRDLLDSPADPFVTKFVASQTRGQDPGVQ